MKTLMCTILALLLCVLAVGPGCVLEDKVVELVLKGTTCVDWTEYHTSAEWNTPLVLDYADSIRKILEDNDIDIEKIKDATLVSMSYWVTQNNNDTHDWNISGFITVQRDEGTVKRMVHYTNQSLDAAYLTPTAADLDAAGVAIINGAFDSFLANPYAPIILTFTTENDAVTPLPTGGDPLDFKWKACMKIHVIYEEKFEIPDPLP
ncbi:hypothetical protein ACFL2Z_01490 [Candidatus Eisenbacteria bacterium]|uniref:Uncharacterized protein n=1 Tax=Eiseniibacteriota bacterium TaxID=2212470 RepID=A0ABV6YNC3_UNCEI